MSDSKKKWIVFAIFISPVLFIAIKGYYQDWKLKHNKDIVYVVGKLIKSTPRGFHAGTATYVYRYNNKNYKVKIADSWPKHFYFFLIDPENPKVSLPQSNILVPPCLTSDDGPKEGWKELPLHACDSIK